MVFIMTREQWTREIEFGLLIMWDLLCGLRLVPAYLMDVISYFEPAKYVFYFTGDCFPLCWRFFRVYPLSNFEFPVSLSCLERFGPNKWYQTNTDPCFHMLASGGERKLGRKFERDELRVKHRKETRHCPRIDRDKLHHKSAVSIIGKRPDTVHVSIGKLHCQWYFSSFYLNRVRHIIQLGQWVSDVRV